MTRVEHEAGIWSAVWRDDRWQVEAAEPGIARRLESLLNAVYGPTWESDKYEPNPLLARAQAIAEELNARVVEWDDFEVPEDAEA